MVEQKIKGKKRVEERKKKRKKKRIYGLPPIRPILNSNPSALPRVCPGDAFMD